MDNGSRKRKSSPEPVPRKRAAVSDNVPEPVSLLLAKAKEPDYVLSPREWSLMAYWTVDPRWGASLSAAHGWEDSDSACVLGSSRWNHPAEPCLYRILLESCGVLAQLARFHIDGFGQRNWMFRTKCPFHRRVHRANHWFVSTSRRDPRQYYIGCFHGRLNYAWLRDLPLT
jgi:hypothetical protein